MSGGQRERGSDGGAELSGALAAALVDALARDAATAERLRAILEPAGTGIVVTSVPGYTADTLATAIGVTPKVVRNAIARGELAAVKRGGRWLISADAVSAWIREDASSPRRRRRTERPAGRLTAAFGALPPAAAPRRSIGSP
jgi:excisionase family DNA binding protein